LQVIIAAAAVRSSSQCTNLCAYCYTVDISNNIGPAVAAAAAFCIGQAWSKVKLFCNFFAVNSRLTYKPSSRLHRTTPWQVQERQQNVAAILKVQRSDSGGATPSEASANSEKVGVAVLATVSPSDVDKVSDAIKSTSMSPTGLSASLLGQLWKLSVKLL